VNIFQHQSENIIKMNSVKVCLPTKDADYFVVFMNGGKGAAHFIPNIGWRKVWPAGNDEWIPLGVDYWMEIPKINDD
jgi:hypothetical protein